MPRDEIDLNPQGAQMADESMIRTLAAQIEAIWPQEKLLLEFLPRKARVLDVGAGTGEFSAKVAAAWPDAQVLGVELLEASVAHARARHAALAPRLKFEVGDAFALRQPDNSFDLVANRHMVQSVPHVERILAELVRVTRPGGRVHVTVLADGFEYQGERYRSLSAVAKAITGSHMNGFRFFGLEGKA